MTKQDNSDEKKVVMPESIFDNKAPEGWHKTDEQYPLVEFTKKGQIILCRFRSAREINTENGLSFLWDVVLKKTGEIVSLWSSTVLESTRERLHIQEGDEIAIEYNGKVKNKTGGREYKSFSIWKP